MKFLFQLKSPLSTAPKLLSAVGTKKPLQSTVTKKSPTIEKTSTTTVTKKTSGTVVKSTVIKKKVVNGDVVEETKQTTVTESVAEEIPSLNGHHLNGNAENGDAHVSEQQQQVAVEQTAI